MFVYLDDVAKAIEYPRYKLGYYLNIVTCEVSKRIDTEPGENEIPLNRAYLNLVTGKVREPPLWADTGPDENEIPIKMPGLMEVELAYVNQMEEGELKSFLLSKCNDEDFGWHFHDRVEEIPKIGYDWLDFQRDMLLDIAKKWCEENDLPYKERRPRKKLSEKELEKELTMLAAELNDYIEVEKTESEGEYEFLKFPQDDTDQAESCEGE